MSNLARYIPFHRLDDFFRGFALKPINLFDEVESDFQIRTDVTENDKNYLVKAELPGVKKEDIQVSVEGNQLIIKAEIKKEKEEKQDEKTVCCERYYGQIYRSFNLGCEVDQAQAQAKYENGVLQLTLPKKPGPATKQISIQ
jgi:HSP20 family protein